MRSMRASRFVEVGTLRKEGDNVFKVHLDETCHTGATTHSYTSVSDDRDGDRSGQGEVSADMKVGAKFIMYVIGMIGTPWDRKHSVSRTLRRQSEPSSDRVRYNENNCLWSCRC